MLDSVFMQVLDMTKTASIVILIVLLARLLLKKAPKIFTYVLWASVLFRLLCPVSIELDVSAVPEFTPVAYSYTLEDEPVSFYGASEAAYQAVGDVLNGGIDIQHVRTTERDEDGNVRYAEARLWEVMILFGQYVWLVGIAGMLIYSTFQYYKLRKRLTGSVPLRDNIFLSDYITSPFVMGLLRPKIYLPSALGEGEQEYIILHEQQHIKRFDHITKALAFLALCVHWFNPLVWLAFVLSGKDMEMSCDEAVIKRMGENIRADYSSSLLSLATGRRIVAGTPLAFGEGDTKERIRNLAKYKKPAALVVIIAVVVSIALAVCFMSDPKKNGKDGYFDGVDMIDELYFDMNEITSDAFAYTVYDGTDTADNYFEAKKEYFFCFSKIYNFLFKLRLSTAADGANDSVSEPQTSGVIKISYDEEWSVSIIFYDDFSKMYMQKHKSDGTSIRSKDYVVEEPSEAKAFFTEKPYADDFRIWEFNPASSAWGNAQIKVYFDSRYKINGDIAGEGKIEKIINEDTGAEGISWSPEIIDNPGVYNIEIPVIRDGEAREFDLTMTMVGKRNISSYYIIYSDELHIVNHSDGYIYEMIPEYSVDSVEWMYDPITSDHLTCVIPLGYKIKSVTATSGTANFYESLFFDLEGNVFWTPEKISEDAVLVINTEKDARSVKFTLNIKFLEYFSSNERRSYEIIPVDCWINNEKIGSDVIELYEIETKENDADTVTFNDLDAGSFDTELIYELLMSEKAVIENGDKKATVFYGNYILSYLGGQWEFEKGYYSHPSGTELSNMKKYSIGVEVDVNRSYMINFDKSCSLMWLSDNKGYYTSTFKVKSPEIVRSFFENEEFFDGALVWEYNPSANTYGYGKLNLIVEGEYESYTATCKTGGLMKAVVADDRTGGIVSSDPVKEITCTKEDNLVWSPDGPNPETVHFKLKLANGTVSDFYMYAQQIGVNYSGNTVYAIYADYARCTLVKRGIVSVKFEQSYDLTWFYNPMAGGTWWYLTNYIFPESYEIKSAEATNGGITVENRYYGEDDGEKKVVWSPALYEDGTSPAETDIVITTVKAGKEVQFKLKITLVSSEEGSSLSTFLISPVNCKMKEEGAALYLLEEK